MHAYRVASGNETALMRPITRSGGKFTFSFDGFVWTETVRCPSGLPKTYGMQNIPRRTDEENGEAVTGKVRRTLGESGDKTDWKAQKT